MAKDGRRQGAKPSGVPVSPPFLRAVHRALKYDTFPCRESRLLRKTGRNPSSASAALCTPDPGEGGEPSESDGPRTLRRPLLAFLSDW